MDFPTNNTFEVFLSFRGEDTRHGFTGHLYNVLRASGFYTFIDEEELAMGEEISRELPKAIEESRISIVVFSKNYASSRWCLDELVKILECKKSKQQMVLPIFYNIDAREVREQTGKFGEAMTKYLGEKGFNHEKVQRWREALTKAANLKGWPCLSNEYEYKLMERICKEVSRKLNRVPLYVADYPVGIDSILLDINKLLQTMSDDVHMLGIYGFGGIGKTTITKAVYNLFIHHFEGHSFLANVRENSKRQSNLVQLQETLLSDLLGNRKWKVGIVDRGISLIKKRLCRRKVLLILDDVDELYQLEKLAVRRDSFGKGSIVIITTRNKHLLTSDFIKYEVKKLSLQRAHQLFSWHAFKGNKSIADYEEVVNRAIWYADGHPLALKVLGSIVCGKSKDVWEDTLDKCKKNQHGDIHKILKISFDRLDETEKDIFLDIAFFFKGVDKDNVETMLKSCGLFPKTNIETLIDRCLITVEDNKFWMHDLVQQMGWKIVQQKSQGEPKEYSRLWFHEDNEDVLEALGENSGLNKIQGVMLDFPKPKELHLSAKVFTMMTSLKVLIVRNAHFSEGFEYLPDRLRWLDWANYPFPLSLNSCSKNLVILNMPCSHIILKEPLKKKFENMVDMNLSRCKFVEKVPDISNMTNLKNLNVGQCHNLAAVHHSIGNHDMLVSLNLQGCHKLRIFPSSLKMKSLKELDLFCCWCLEKVPDIFATPNLKRLSVVGCKNLVEIHQSVGFHDTLVSLYIRNCPNLRIFPSSLKMKSLEDLNIYGCSSLDKFPNIIGRMESFKTLIIKGTAIKELPSSIEYLTGVETLELRCCINDCPKPGKFMMEEGDDRQPMSYNIRSTNDNFSTLRLPVLRALTLENCNLSHLDFLRTLSCFRTLYSLNLSKNNFVTIPKSICKFERLGILELSSCKLLQEIPMLPPNICKVNAANCISLNFESRSRLLSQELYQMKSKLIVSRIDIERRLIVSGTDIPMWFNIRGVGSSISFLADRKFPNYTLCIAFGVEGEESKKFCFGKSMRINGHSVGFRLWPGFDDLERLLEVNSNNLWLEDFDIGSYISDNIWNDWNYVEIEINSLNPGVIIKELGIHVACTCPPQNCCCWKCGDEEDDVESNSYPQDRRLKLVNECQGTITSTSYQPLFPNDHELLPLPPDYFSICNDEMILPGLDMGPVDSNDKGKGVLGFDAIVSGGKALGSSSVPYSDASTSNGYDAFEAREGCPPRIRDNTEHSPLPGSEMGHHRVLALPMETALDTALGPLGWPYMGVQSTVIDGLDAREGCPPIVHDNTENSPLPGSEMGHRVSNNAGVLALPMETTLDTALGPLGWPCVGVQSTVNDGIDLDASSIVDPFETTEYDDYDFNGYPLQKRRRNS